METAFSISVKGIRAIEKADIALKGITVLTGDNGCGKTTISKLFYSFVKTSVNFRQIVSDIYSSKILVALSFLEEFFPEREDLADKNFDFDFIQFATYDYVTAIRKIKRKQGEIEKYIYKAILPRVQLLKKLYNEKKYTIDTGKFERLNSLFKRKLKVDVTNKKDVLGLLEGYEQYLTNLAEEITKVIESRNITVFNRKFSEYFEDDITNWFYTFQEYSEELINKKTGFVLEQKTFSDTIYIDSPTIFDNVGTRTRVNGSYFDLSQIMNNTNSIQPKNEALDSIITDILHGQIIIKDDIFSHIFIYKSKDGKEIPLSQAASGVKCFAILERLYSVGLLTPDTLLIIDEPEVHLHPKWVVEYARVIISIQKYLGTTILLASHSPDMISALRYIAAKEKCHQSLVFYHAEKIDSTDFGKYQFKYLGLDIEEIFASFNIALDRINQYGEFEDE
ncbi:MAG: AAA family ATPase [Spirochaetaceae bacterium]|nr:AAA family ATPase [Spirochaetaceae bacterium]